MAEDPSSVSSDPTSPAGKTGKVYRSSGHFECAGCAKDLPAASYTNSQLKKGFGKHKCKSCAEAEQEELAAAQATAKASKLAALKAALDKAEASGTPLEKAKARSALADFEAGVVTNSYQAWAGKVHPCVFTIIIIVCCCSCRLCSPTGAAELQVAKGKDGELEATPGKGKEKEEETEKEETEEEEVAKEREVGRVLQVGVGWWVGVGLLTAEFEF